MSKASSAYSCLVVGITLAVVLLMYEADQAEAVPRGRGGGRGRGYSYRAYGGGVSSSATGFVSSNDTGLILICTLLQFVQLSKL